MAGGRSARDLAKLAERRADRRLINTLDQAKEAERAMELCGHPRNLTELKNCRADGGRVCARGRSRAQERRTHARQPYPAVAIRPHIGMALTAGGTFADDKPRVMVRMLNCLYKGGGYDSKMECILPFPPTLVAPLTVLPGIPQFSIWLHKAGAGL